MVGSVRLRCTVGQLPYSNESVIFIDIPGPTPSSSIAAWVPKEKVLVDEQDLTGPSLKCHVEAKVIRDLGDQYVVEVPGRPLGNGRRMQVPKTFVL